LPALRRAFPERLEWRTHLPAMQDLRNLAAGHRARPLRRAASKLTGSRYDPEPQQRLPTKPTVLLPPPALTGWKPDPDPT
jgi:hypothetical protein